MVLIIDKMASYVAKNGRAFEDIVRSKCDKRFAFLDDTHHLHALYKTKVAHHVSLLQPPKKKRKKALQESRDQVEPIVSTVELQPTPKPEAQDTDMAVQPEVNGIENDQPPPPGEGDILIGPRQEHSPEPELQNEADPEPMEENTEERIADEKQQYVQSPAASEEREYQQENKDKEGQREEEEEQQQQQQQQLLQQQQEQKDEDDKDEKEKEEGIKEVEEERNNDSEMDNENTESQKHSERSSREVSPTTDSEKEGQPRINKPDA